MYNPIRYDENSAINYISGLSSKKIYLGLDDICQRLIEDWGEKEIVAIDGYIAADFEKFKRTIKKKDNSICFVSTDEFMKSKEEINEMLKEYLPHDPIKDPYDTFGKLYPGFIEDFFDVSKINLKTDSKICIYGSGSSCSIFEKIVSKIVYIDLTPKDAVIRAQDDNYFTIGDSQQGDFKKLMRRYYYIDVEVVMRHRKSLIQEKRINYYVLETWKDEWSMLDIENLYYIFDHLASQPFRAKPIYLDGVWGGHYIRRIRHVPEDIAPRIAWSFEFIPLEASVLIAYKDSFLDIPFYTYLNAKENEIIGYLTAKRFNGNFPIRFNYDDTWHSSGNMSIQCHPNKNYALENYNEDNSQDEAYYVVQTGSDAKTYCGFHQSQFDFIEKCKDAFDNRKELDYRKYVYSETSHNGLQVMIPAGTVHGSGRNQVVLELGSFTVGAYTYKMYDYNRKDIDGNYRPIHLENAKEVLDVTRDNQWIKKNSIIEPILYKRTQDYSEVLIGKNDYMYYETHQLTIKEGSVYQCLNNNEFTVLTLADGEEIEIFDVDNPDRKYTAHYLDVVVVPASIREYGVKVISDHPVVLHKAILKREE